MRHAPPARRRGSTIPEAALVLSTFMMFVFGILEYGRYLLVLHISTNAAREGARHAVVRATAPEAATFTAKSSPRYPGRTVYEVPFIESYVVSRMGGVNNMITNFDVLVFPCDTDSLFASPVAVRPKADPPAPEVRSWSKAAFSERIAVHIAGEYRPILPTFLFMSDSVPVNAVALMGSEG